MRCTYRKGKNLPDNLPDPDICMEVLSTRRHSFLSPDLGVSDLT